MRIIQISDSHIAHDIPLRLQDLDNCVTAVNAEAPDLVIHTGDITHNGLAKEYDAARQSLDKLRSPYCVLPGNKDVRTALRNAFHDHPYLTQTGLTQSGLTQTDTDGPAPTGDFIQYSLEQYPVRLILIDTLRESASKGELCQQRLTHLEDMLEQDTGRPVIIFMHHSPFMVQEIPDPYQFHNWQDIEAFESVLSRYGNIESIYCGHVHRNVEGTIGSLPVHVLSCMATDLRRGELSTADKTRPFYRIIDLP